MDLRFLFKNRFYTIITKKELTKNSLLVILSGIISNLSYPEANLFFINFFVLIPLFYVIYKSDTLLHTFFYGFLYGFVFNTILFFWLKIFHPLSLPAVLLGLSIYSGLLFLLSKILIRYFPKLKILIIPSVWTAIEYIRSIGFLGFPWGLVAHSQWNFLPFIQISEIFGIWIITFLVVLINLLLFEYFYSFNREYIVSALIILLLPILYGIVRIENVKSNMAKMDRLKLALIQGNVDPNLYWNDIKYDVLSEFTVLSEKASLHNPDMIVWTETTILDYIKIYSDNWDKYLRYSYLRDKLKYAENVVRLPKDLNRYIFTGILDYDKKIRNGKIVNNDYNAAVLISPKGKIIDVYRKNHLVPFGEWFPYGKYFPFIEKILQATWAGDFTPSNRKTVFKIKKGNQYYRFSCLICYEGVFGNLTRLFVLRGAEFLLNITNDMWSFNRRAEFQHMIADVFRAVENRVPYIRSANSGVTGWINQYGKVVKRLPLFKKGFLIIDVPVEKKNGFTFYTRFGDFFPIILMLFLSLLTGIIILHKILKLSVIARD